MSVAVSIVIPTHNSEADVAAALESVLGQTLKNIEILVIDSSTDNTLHIAERYQKIDKRIRVFADPNSSYGHKINRGIQEAQGGYLAILESDDLIRCDMLEILYRLASSYQIDYVKCSFSDYFSNGGTPFQLDHDRYPDGSMVNRIVDPVKETKVLPYLLNNIWSGLYSVPFLRKNQIILNESPGASYQDTGFSVLSAIYAKKVILISDCLYLYRRDNTVSSVKQQEKYGYIFGEINWIKNEVQRRRINTELVDSYIKDVEERVYIWNALRLMPEYREKFYDLLDDEMRAGISKQVIAEEKRRKKEERQFDQVLGLFRKGMNVCVFGAGVRGRSVCELERYLNRKCICEVIDNDPAKEGCDFYGHSIKPGNYLLEAKKDIDRILIANEKNGEAIAFQLRQYGIADGQMIMIPEFPDGNSLVRCLTRLSMEYEHAAL